MNCCMKASKVPDGCQNRGDTQSLWISVGGALLLPTRHPAQRRRERITWRDYGTREAVAVMPSEKLNRTASGRARVAMGGAVADWPVVVMRLL